MKTSDVGRKVKNELQLNREGRKKRDYFGTDK